MHAAEFGMGEGHFSRPNIATSQRFQQFMSGLPCAIGATAGLTTLVILNAAAAPLFGDIGDSNA